MLNQPYLKYRTLYNIYTHNPSRTLKHFVYRKCMLKKKTYKASLRPTQFRYKFEINKNSRNCFANFYHLYSFDLIMRFQLSRKSDNNGKDLIAVWVVTSHIDRWIERAFNTSCKIHISFIYQLLPTWGICAVDVEIKTTIFFFPF